MASFKLYRYQLLPIDRHTDDMYADMSIAELIRRKNGIFADSLQFVETYRHRGTDLLVQLHRSDNHAFVLHLAPNRPLTRERPDFRTEQIDNWPHVTAIILNREDEQFIAVQDRATAFTSTDTVVKVIDKGVRSDDHKSSKSNLAIGQRHACLTAPAQVWRVRPD